MGVNAAIFHNSEPAAGVIHGGVIIICDLLELERSVGWTGQPKTTHSWHMIEPLS